jgi:hypothetical protein
VWPLLYQDLWTTRNAKKPLAKKYYAILGAIAPPKVIVMEE